MKKTNKVLVTGAGGFIGSHLVEELIRKKFHVKAFLKYNSNSNLGWLQSIKSKKNLEIIYGDVRDFDSINKAIKGSDYIINLAAMISVPYSFENPQSFVDTNVLGLLNIIRSANLNKKKIKKIVQISSSEVYGNLMSKGKTNLLETDILKSESPYAASKISSDHLATSMYKALNLPIVVARPFNTFGPRQSLRAVIPTIICQFLKPKNNKADIKIGSTSTKRDFVYVKDTVNGLIKIMLNRTNSGEIYNIATNNSHKVSDVVKYISQITKIQPQLKIKTQRKRDSEVYELKGSNLKLYKSTGWKPKYLNKNGFKLALRETLLWFEKKENMKHYNNVDSYHI